MKSWVQGRGSGGVIRGMHTGRSRGESKFIKRRKKKIKYKYIFGWLHLLIQ
jgi:hypothetical protein